MSKTNLIKPDYYDDFYCIGSDCKQTCCGGWAITMSKEEYRRLKKSLDNPEILIKFSDVARTNGNYAEFRKNEVDRCPLQTENGLCGLQLAHGEKALTRTCSTFPRKGIKSGHIVQASLSPGCEKVLSLLMERKDGIQFTKERCEIPESLPVEVLVDKRKGNILDDYVDLYQFSVLILQAKDVPLEDRLILLGLGLRGAQELADKNKFDEIPIYLDNYILSLEQADKIEELIPKAEPNAAAQLNQLISIITKPTLEVNDIPKLMERLKQELNVEETLGEDGQTTFTMSAQNYQENQQEFHRFFDDREHFLENLLVAIVTFKGFPLEKAMGTSVWDNYMYLCWLYSSLKFMLTACIQTIRSDDDVFAVCVPLLREWVHNKTFPKNTVKRLHETGTDTLAHLVMMLKSC